MPNDVFVSPSPKRGRIHRYLNYGWQILEGDVDDFIEKSIKKDAVTATSDSSMRAASRA